MQKCCARSVLVVVAKRVGRDSTNVYSPRAMPHATDAPSWALCSVHLALKSTKTLLRLFLNYLFASERHAYCFL